MTPENIGLLLENEKKIHVPLCDCVKEFGREGSGGFLGFLVCFAFCISPRLSQLAFSSEFLELYV